MKIVGIYNVCHTDADEFFKSLDKSITNLQEDRQEVEIQYSSNVMPNGQLIQTALIIGRK